MDSLLIAPRNRKELRLISDVLKEMGIASKPLTLGEKEDIGLGMAMKDVDRSKNESANLILQKLRA